MLSIAKEAEISKEAITQAIIDEEFEKFKFKLFGSSQQTRNAWLLCTYIFFGIVLILGTKFAINSQWFGHIQEASQTLL